jgi:antitoxin component of MazEF toxin-antitoxin module
MQVFKSKIRRIGNAEGVIIPQKVLRKIGAKEGDSIRLSVLPPQETRDKALLEMIGMFKGKKRFDRDWKDRF